MPSTSEVANTTQAQPSGAAQLLRNEVVVVNIGLASFAEDLHGQGVPVTQVEWTPPAGGDPQMAALLAKLGA